jgi:hypothetical protein
VRRVAVESLRGHPYVAYRRPQQITVHAGVASTDTETPYFKLFVRGL